MTQYDIINHDESEGGVFFLSSNNQLMNAPLHNDGSWYIDEALSVDEWHDEFVNHQSMLQIYQQLINMKYEKLAPLKVKKVQ